MGKINLDKEWTFIKDEIHTAATNNILKRELLFILQILLSNTNFFTDSIYIKSKKTYLNTQYLTTSTGILFVW